MSTDKLEITEFPNRCLLVTNSKETWPWVALLADEGV